MASNKTPHTLSVDWKLTGFCNFRCQYCFSSQNEKEKRAYPAGKRYAEMAANGFSKLDNRTCRIHLAGGEPFLYPAFVYLCKLLTKSHYIGMNTNLTTSNVPAFANSIDPDRVSYIYASCHITELVRTGLYDRFINNVLYLKKMRFSIRVDFVFYPPLINRIKLEIQRMKDLGLPVNLISFRGRFGRRAYPGSYTDVERSFVQKFASDQRQLMLVDSTISKFSQLCAAGHRHIRIDQKGYVYRCNTSKRKIGNIFRGTVSLDNISKPCPFFVCDCPYEGLDHAIESPAAFTHLLKEMVKEYPPYYLGKLRYYKLRRYIEKNLPHGLGIFG